MLTFGIVTIIAAVIAEALIVSKKINRYTVDNSQW